MTSQPKQFSLLLLLTVVSISAAILGVAIAPTLISLPISLVAATFTGCWMLECGHWKQAHVVIVLMIVGLYVIGELIREVLQ